MNFYKTYQKYLKYVFVALIVMIGGICYFISRVHNNEQSSELELQAEKKQMELETVDTELSETSASQAKTDPQSGIDQEEPKLYIYVCGEVTEPGVYQCMEGSRIFELIEMAGGFTQAADTTYLNLVDKVTDGQKLLVPQLGENGGSTPNQKDSNGLVNINTATKDQLMELPGIGESKANDIIQSRTSEGLFQSTEDIMRISGIKESAYSKLKDLICV